MDNIISFLAGSVHKYYDDVQDNKEITDPLFLETVKVLMITIMTINFTRNPSFSAFFFIIIGIYYSLGRIDCDFWKACVCIPFITTLVSYDQYAFLGSMDFIQRMFYVFFVGTIMYFEDGLVPEETSVRKTIIRIGLIFLVLFFIWLYQNLDSKSLVNPVSYFLIGYLITNIIYHRNTIFDAIGMNKTASPEKSLEKEIVNKATLSKNSSHSDLESPQPADSHTHLYDSNNSLLKSQEAQ
jgi:hypothetical protein